MGGLCSKDLFSSIAFREWFLNATFGVKAAGCLAFFGLVGEVTR